MNMSVPLDTILGKAYEGRHRANLEDQQGVLCKWYKNVALPSESETLYFAIKAW
jgi:hypothetical protein